MEKGGGGCGKGQGKKVASGQDVAGIIPCKTNSLQGMEVPEGGKKGCR